MGGVDGIAWISDARSHLSMSISIGVSSRPLLFVVWRTWKRMGRATLWPG